MPNFTIRAVPVHINLYRIVQKAVETGVERGYQRAHKHTETPSAETLKLEIERAVMLEIDDSLDIEDTRKVDFKALTTTLRDCIVELQQLTAELEDGHE